MNTQDKVDLIRYFDNLNDHSKLQAFIMVCNGDLDFILKQAREFRRLYMFNIISDEE